MLQNLERENPSEYILNLEKFRRNEEKIIKKKTIREKINIKVLP